MNAWVTVFRKLCNSAADFYRRLRIRRDLSGLTATNPQISAAVFDAADRKTSKAESDWIRRIEHLRHEMKASSEELEFMDYGAGSGGAKFTEQEMYRGRVVRKTIGQICTTTSRTDRTALLLLRLVRELKPCTCIELGTSVGVSACYQAAALKLNGAGKLVTLEGADSVASVAVRNFSSLGLDNVEVVRGRFQDTLPELLLTNPCVDYAFIDGHHDEIATLNYFNAFVPALTAAAVVIFDDIDWSEGMKRAWHTIQHHPSARVSVNLGSMGLISTSGDRPRMFSTKF